MLSVFSFSQISHKIGFKKWHELNWLIGSYRRGRFLDSEAECDVTLYVHHVEHSNASGDVRLSIPLSKTAH